MNLPVDQFLSSIHAKLDALALQNAALESRIADLARALGRRTDQGFCSWSEAARLMGLDGGNTAARARERIRYAKNKVGGPSIKTIRGAVCRVDLLRFLDLESAKYRGRAEKVRAAIRQ